MRYLALPITAVAIIALALSGCSASEPAAKPAAANPSSSFVEVTPPAASATTTDARQDVSNVSAKAASAVDYPEGDTADVALTIINHSATPATYDVILGVYDEALTQVGSIRVNTDASGQGPTKPGGTLKLTGSYGSDVKLPKPFTVDVQSVERDPAA
jgi:hypothetical protein